MRTLVEPQSIFLTNKEPKIVKKLKFGQLGVSNNGPNPGHLHLGTKNVEGKRSFFCLTCHKEVNHALPVSPNDTTEWILFPSNVEINLKQE